jgi:3-mercaptopyruvate sulfurtransferase SseA
MSDAMGTGPVAGHQDVSDLIGGYAAWLAVHEPPDA